MKLYRLEAAPRGVELSGEDPFVVWVGTQSDAATQRKTWVDEGFKRADITTEEVEVPTDKKGLLAFLNANSV